MHKAWSHTDQEEDARQTDARVICEIMLTKLGHPLDVKDKKRQESKVILKIAQVTWQTMITSTSTGQAGKGAGCSGTFTGVVGTEDITFKISLILIIQYYRDRCLDSGRIYSKMR